MGFLSGKKFLIVGVANKSSIATGIAEAMAAQGAELAFTYQTEKLKSRVLDIAERCNSRSDLCWECDVASDDSIAAVMENVHKAWGNFDGLVHSVAFVHRDQLEGNFAKVTNRAGFLTAHEISSFSFIALSQAALPYLNAGSSLLTLSYLGSVRTMPNYNVMGVAKASLEATTRYLAASLGEKQIRANAISAGPIRTLAASGIKDLKKMLDYNAARAPLGRNVTTAEVGNAAAFLASDLASGITGEILYVDGGFNITAMGNNEV